MSLQEFQHQVLPVRDKLFRMAYRIMGNCSEAEDIVQEAFIKLWKTRDELHRIANIEAWSIRIAKNLAIDKLRNKHNKTQELEAALPLAATTANPYQEAAQNDLFAHIRQVMDQLPDKQRMVMQLRDIEGLSYQEIVDALELPMPQVKVNLFRARQTVKNQLIQSRTLD